MYRLICANCGNEFTTSNIRQEFCCVACKKECLKTPYEAPKKKKKRVPNKELIDIANEADRLGISYGQLMYQRYREKK